MVGVHPDPVDRCPCFEDSVCFMGVLIGLIPGSWVYAHSPYSWDQPARGTVPYDVRAIGLVVSIVRVVFGKLEFGTNFSDMFCLENRARKFAGSMT